jgi:hypothetical protein
MTDHPGGLSWALRLESVAGSRIRWPVYHWIKPTDPGGGTPRARRSLCLRRALVCLSRWEVRSDIVA